MGFDRSSPPSLQTVGIAGSKAFGGQEARSPERLDRQLAGSEWDRIAELRSFDTGAKVEHEPSIMPSFVPFRRGLHRAGNLIAGN
jgi:hypothetical protein